MRLPEMTEKQFDSLAGQDAITFNDGLLLGMLLLKASGHLHWPIWLIAGVYFSAVIGLGLFAFFSAYVWDRFADWWNR